ncbi:MAG: HNH endonuclease signature motif containing protein [Pseudomonadota bacterium]
MSEEWGPWNSEYVDINPIAGSIIWRYRPRSSFLANEQEYQRWNALYAHTPAFACLNRKGYLTGRIHGNSYLAHRVIWAYSNGTWPSGELDHINGEKTDNRIANLREVSRTQNCRNLRKNIRNTSGCTGVKKSRSGKKWVAEIGCGAGKKVHLGSFENFDDAVAARKSAELVMGYSARHGS